jgi:prevent-host-death family protein
MEQEKKMEITVSEARERLSEIINESAFGKKRFVLNRRGRPLAAIVPLEDLEELENHKTAKPERNKAIKQ